MDVCLCVRGIISIKWQVNYTQLMCAHTHTQLDKQTKGLKMFKFAKSLVKN